MGPRPSVRRFRLDRWFKGEQSEAAPLPRLGRGVDRRCRTVSERRAVLGMVRPPADAGRRGREGRLGVRKQALSIAEDLFLVDLRVRTRRRRSARRRSLGRDDRPELTRQARGRGIGRWRNWRWFPAALQEPPRSVWTSWTCFVSNSFAMQAFRGAERIGDAPAIRFLDGDGIGMFWILGRMGRGSRDGDRFIAECAGIAAPAGGDQLLVRGGQRGRRWAHRPGARGLPTALAPRARPSSGPQNMVPHWSAAHGRTSAWSFRGCSSGARGGVAVPQKDPFGAAVDARGSRGRPRQRQRGVHEILEPLPPKRGRSATLALVEGRFKDAVKHHGTATFGSSRPKHASGEPQQLSSRRHRRRGG